MANQQHLDILTRQGVSAWNQWRADNPDIKPDLSGADLRKADLRNANFRYADLRRVNFQRAKIGGVNFGYSDLSGADLWYVDFRGGNTTTLFTHAKITDTKWPSADAMTMAWIHDARP